MQRKQEGFTFIEIMVVVGIIGFIVAIAAANYFTARKNAQGYMCTENLAKMHGAKQRWGFENNAEETDVPTFDDILPYLDTKEGQLAIECPAGGTYSLNPLNEVPTCSLQSTEGRHSLQK
ncbi:MAG TPA: type II secretion system protein [bacterium]|nr:type II secretion system protein [bacterium]